MTSTGPARSCVFWEALSAPRGGGPFCALRASTTAQQQQIAPMASLLAYFGAPSVARGCARARAAAPPCAALARRRASSGGGGGGAGAPTAAPAPPLTTPTWSLRQAYQARSGEVALDDSVVAHVARLAHIDLQPGSPEFRDVKASLVSVLGCMRDVAATAAAARVQGAGASSGGAAGAGGAPAAPGARGAGGLGGGTPPRTTGDAAAAPGSPQLSLDDPLAGLTEEEFEALAEARFAELRGDAVTDGGRGDALLAHAARRQGAYFAVPKVVE